tara:strand:+ start:90 stop:881 length:792 start_codon:yes stop_codon:yes gene_type:complete
MKKKEKEKILSKVEKGLEVALKNKMDRYERETTYMPFAEAILGEKNTAIYSFGISITTWFGQNRKGGYEELARILGEAAGKEVHTQYHIPFNVSKETSSKIYELYQNIRKKIKNPDVNNLSKEIESFSSKAEGVHEDKVVDVYIKDKEDNLLFIDISSPKANMKESGALKLKLMNWLALGYANYKYNSISAIIGFPYNPYHPKPYSRFSTEIFDKDKDILIQEKFWAAIAGFDVYDDLIKIVQKVGKKNQKKMLKKIKEISGN